MRGPPLSLPLLMAGLVVLLGAAAYLLWPGHRSLPAEVDSAALAAALDGLQDSADAFAGPDPDRPLAFPADHGAHPDSPGELWDLSALLTDTQGRRYGVRFSGVRLGLRAPGEARASEFAADAIVGARLGLAAEGAAGVVGGQRLSRTALGLAGAVGGAGGSGAAAGGEVWVEDWRLERTDDDGLRLTAAADGATLALSLAATRAPVDVDAAELLGREGAGAALRAYLQPAFQATGTLTLDGQARPVQGTAWIGHAWGAAAGVAGGGPGRLALNRFEVQLDGGPTLACIHLRRRSGGGTPIPTCLVAAPSGETRVLRRRDLRLEPTGKPWTAPDGGAYPLRWRLAVPAMDLVLDLDPLIRNQLQTFIVPVWSGIVLVQGRHGDVPVSGAGRMDLGGYGRAAGDGPGT
jgi:predicted secreted hydrolase